MLVIKFKINKTNIKFARPYMSNKPINVVFGQLFIIYICAVHTAVLFQSLAGIYCQTQHVKY
jgi:hypothetical protein